MFTAEDYVEAEQAHARLIWRLNKYGGRQAHRLARILNRCTGNTPCRSGACPVCGFAAQRAAVRLCEATIGEPARALRGRMTALTIVPSLGCVPPDGLTVELCHQIEAKVASAVRSFALPPALLWLDFSFNEDLLGELPPHWSVHTHGIALDWLSKVQKANLRQPFAPSDLVRRPVKVEPLDQRDEGREYAPKWQRFRRQRYLATPAHRAPHKRTRPKSLRPLQSVKLALVEHRLGLTARVISNRPDDPAMQAFLSALGWARDGP